MAKKILVLADLDGFNPSKLSDIKKSPKFNKKWSKKIFSTFFQRQKTG